MNIVCLIIVPLFFIMISLYFRLWMDNDDFRCVRALFFWGLAVGIIYWTLLPLVSGQFDNKIAMSSILVKSLLIDGLLFAVVVVTSLFGLCYMLAEDSAHNMSIGATGCFGYLCGILTVSDILAFVGQTYTDDILRYIPYLLWLVGICSIFGIFYGMFRDSHELWQKLIYLPVCVVSCGLLTGLYAFIAFFQNWIIWIIAGVCLAPALVLYFIDYLEYSE